MILCRIRLNLDGDAHAQNSTVLLAAKREVTAAVPVNSILEILNIRTTTGAASDLAINSISLHC